MTATYHTQIAQNANRQASVINAALATLDQQIGDMVDGTHTFTGISIGGGSIDGATIGGTTTGDADFTTLKATGNLLHTPAFMVHKGSVIQSIGATTLALVTWSTAALDTDSDFDLVTNERFTPQVAGWYYLYVNIVWSVMTAGKQWLIYLRKNGAALNIYNAVGGGTTNEGGYMDGLFYANGSSDYFDVQAYNGDTVSRDIDGSSAKTYFYGYRIR